MTVLSLTASQSAQWTDLLPLSVQVGSLSTVKSLSHAWPAAAISSVTVSPQTEQTFCLLPASVQVGSTVVSQSP